MPSYNKAKNRDRYYKRLRKEELSRQKRLELQEKKCNLQTFKNHSLY